MAVAGGTGSVCGCAPQTNRPVSTCSPGSSLRAGTPSCSTTAAAALPTRTSWGQAPGPPGRGTQVSRKDLPMLGEQAAGGIQVQVQASGPAAQPLPARGREGAGALVLALKDPGDPGLEGRRDLRLRIDRVDGGQEGEEAEGGHEARHWQNPATGEACRDCSREPVGGTCVGLQASCAGMAATRWRSRHLRGLDGDRAATDIHWPAGLASPPDPRLRRRAGWSRPAHRRRRHPRTLG